MCCAISYIPGLATSSRSLPLKSDTIEHRSMPVPHALGELDLDSQRDWREVFNHEVFEHVLRPQDVINKVRIELSEVVLG